MLRHIRMIVTSQYTHRTYIMTSHRTEHAPDGGAGDEEGRADDGGQPLQPGAGARDGREDHQPLAAAHVPRRGAHETRHGIKPLVQNC